MSNAMRELKIEEIECVVGTHGGTSQGFAMGVTIGACLGFLAGGPVGAFAGAVSGGMHGAMMGHYLFEFGLISFKGSRTRSGPLLVLCDPCKGKYS